MEFIHSRRHFLASASLVATSSFFGPRESLAAEGPPETTTIRLKKHMAICFAPLYVLKEFLGVEGFGDVQYVTVAPGRADISMVGQGNLDFDVTFAGAIVHELDAGLRLTALGGLHVGCYELFAREPIRTISDLKGRRVALIAPNSGEHLYLSIMATEIGLDAKKDIDWAFGPDAMERFIAGAAAREQWLCGALRLCAGDHSGDPLRPLARVRFRRHAPVLWAPPARSRHDQQQPERAPPRGHRLAFRQRTQARA
jgi:NitT/TauT family transport system substrate-binding protein